VKAFLTCIFSGDCEKLVVFKNVTRDCSRPAYRQVVHNPLQSSAEPIVLLSQDSAVELHRIIVVNVYIVDRVPLVRS